MAARASSVAGPSAGRTFDFNHIPAYDYFDLTTRFAITDHFDLTLTGVQHFDAAPDRRQRRGHDIRGQRQHLPVDLRRVGPPLQRVGSAEVLSFGRLR